MLSLLYLCVFWTLVLDKVVWLYLHILLSFLQLSLVITSGVQCTDVMVVRKHELHVEPTI